MAPSFRWRRSSYQLCRSCETLRAVGVTENAWKDNERGTLSILNPHHSGPAGFRCHVSCLEFKGSQPSTDCQLSCGDEYHWQPFPESLGFRTDLRSGLPKRRKKGKNCSESLWYNLCQKAKARLSLSVSQLLWWLFSSQVRRVSLRPFWRASVLEYLEKALQPVNALKRQMAGSTD